MGNFNLSKGDCYDNNRREYNSENASALLFYGCAMVYNAFVSFQIIVTFFYRREYFDLFIIGLARYAFLGADVR
jgi:hypothetical protein